MPSVIWVYLALLLVVDVLLLLFKEEPAFVSHMYTTVRMFLVQGRIFFLAATRTLKGWPGKSAGVPPYPQRCIYPNLPIGQQSPSFLAPGTGFLEDSFSKDWGCGMFGG